MFVNINAPPLTIIRNPTTRVYVESWMFRHRSADDDNRSTEKRSRLGYSTIINCTIEFAKRNLNEENVLCRVICLKFCGTIEINILMYRITTLLIAKWEVWWGWSSPHLLYFAKLRRIRYTQNIIYDYTTVRCTYWRYTSNAARLGHESYLNKSNSNIFSKFKSREIFNWFVEIWFRQIKYQVAQSFRY